MPQYTSTYQKSNNPVTKSNSSVLSQNV